MQQLQLRADAPALSVFDCIESNRVWCMNFREEVAFPAGGASQNSSCWGCDQTIDVNVWTCECEKSEHIVQLALPE